MNSDAFSDMSEPELHSKLMAIATETVARLMHRHPAALPHMMAGADASIEVKVTGAARIALFLINSDDRRFEVAFIPFNENSESP